MSPSSFYHFKAQIKNSLHGVRLIFCLYPIICPIPQYNRVFGKDPYWNSNWVWGCFNAFLLRFL
jgi:hypothetical protein